MAHTYAYYYVGAIEAEIPPAKKHILQGKITLSTDVADAYSQTDRLTLTFPQVSNIERVLGLFADGVVNTGQVPFFASISGRSVVIGLLECANAIAPLAEKAEEVHDQKYSIYCTVVGV